MEAHEFDREAESSESMDFRIFLKYVFHFFYSFYLRSKFLKFLKISLFQKIQNIAVFFFNESKSQLKVPLGETKSKALRRRRSAPE